MISATSSAVRCGDALITRAARAAVLVAAIDVPKPKEYSTDSPAAVTYQLAWLPARLLLGSNSPASSKPPTIRPRPANEEASTASPTGSAPAWLPACMTISFPALAAPMTEAELAGFTAAFVLKIIRTPPPDPVAELA